MTGENRSRDILQKLAEAQQASCIPAIYDDIREAFGVDNIVYHAVNIRGLTRDGAFLRLTYSDEWISRYYDEDYFKIDPVVEEGVRAFMPFIWSDLDWSTKRRREFAEDADAHGVGTSGLTVPIRGPGGQHALFSVATSRSDKAWKKQLQEHLPDLHNFAHHLHQATLRVEGVAPCVNKVTLSVRERDVLQWASEGKTTEEIAMILSIAERTVRVYLDTARHKLGASNRTHAVARAISLSLIQAPD